MAFNEQVGRLIEKLTAWSREGKLLWEETADPEAFQAVVSKSVVTVRPDLHEPGSFTLEIRDQYGRTVDTVSSGSTRTSDRWLNLEELHGLARRSALHADEVLADLLSALE